MAKFRQRGVPRYALHGIVPLHGFRPAKRWQVGDIASNVVIHVQELVFDKLCSRLC
jgi:hypothetical protein